MPVAPRAVQRSPADASHRVAWLLATKSPHWDGKVIAVQVTDSKESTIEVRILASASSAPRSFDLHSELREQLIDYLQKEYPALPRRRQEVLDETPLVPRQAERQADAANRRS